MDSKAKSVETLELMSWHFEHIKATQLKRTPEVHHQHFCSFKDDAKKIDSQLTQK